MAEMRYSPKDEQALMTELWDPEIAEDPEKFVLFNYPWGQDGTPLHKRSGPRSWQREDLQEIADHIKSNKALIAKGEMPRPFRKSTVSGRGPGKSALVSWLTNWQMSCNIGSTCILAANTEEQLKSKTMAEVGKWFTLGINSHWFDKTVMSVTPATWYRKLLEDELKVDCGYYYAKAILWSEENPDAFAGAHNPLGMMLLFDEASGIPKAVWSVSEGFFTEPDLHRYWMVYSNGRRNNGQFYDTHEGLHPWPRRRQLDSRTVEDIDTSVLEAIIQDHGPDSDEARIEVYGQFPDTGENQFIEHSRISGAAEREVEQDEGAPLILGLDVARGGKAKSVARFRKGRDARSIGVVRWAKLSNIELAHKVAELIDYYQPDAVNVDAGQGSGVIDYLRDVMGYKVNEVWFGGKADKPERWGNKRIEMYADLRDWLPGAAIDNDPRLKRDLGGLRRYQPKNRDVWFLEPKQYDGELDDSDALALTFAVKVARRDSRTAKRRRPRVIHGVDYNVFGNNYR